MKHLKIYENWFKDYFKQPEIPKQDQEEIDKQLYDAIVKHKSVADIFSAIDALKKGANPNQVEDQGRGYEYSLLMIVSSNFNLKLIEELIKNGVDVYFKAYQWNKENRWENDTDEINDYWDWVNKIVFFEHRPKIYAIIKKYHPDFDEERELRKETEKYNL